MVAGESAGPGEPGWQNRHHRLGRGPSSRGGLSHGMPVVVAFRLEWPSAAANPVRRQWRRRMSEWHWFPDGRSTFVDDGIVMRFDAHGEPVSAGILGVVLDLSGPGPGARETDRAEHERRMEMWRQRWRLARLAVGGWIPGIAKGDALDGNGALVVRSRVGFAGAGRGVPDSGSRYSEGSDGGEDP
ncbi:protein of unknown function [Candidatus Hydrogenisulfobacillus filiaventi]|uniref:Uncharacterized protein n=1 Tax=Candidatus Hydrogenisulfobacillus filiaventi TaxID=2707344 RepID=A0A6F8ZIH3_9FIRM|nr:protein of unknown function [Candidatus Hydrogenisulfobacillus filiaventi]